LLWLGVGVVLLFLYFLGLLVVCLGLFRLRVLWLGLIGL
jgi:Na+-transporting methylmalonyl-CoA/oxaloacetate decarboxylase gamma subunit